MIDWNHIFFSPFRRGPVTVPENMQGKIVNSAFNLTTFCVTKALSSLNKFDITSHRTIRIVNIFFSKPVDMCSRGKIEGNNGGLRGEKPLAHG